MIIKDLGNFIKIDEIHPDAKKPDLCFLSSILGFEMLSIEDNWPGRIYTSKFINEVLRKKKPRVYSKCLRVLKPNTPIKFKSKDKVVWVTMFEPEKIKSSVMFYFDDSVNTYLYIKAFTDIASSCKNDQFMLYVQKGISYVYLDATLSRSSPYISTEDTIEKIKNISRNHSDSKIALIIPNFGYENLFVQLIRAFPQNVFPTKTQRYILTILGYKELLGTNFEECKIIIFIPGFLTEDLEKDMKVVFITVGKAPLDSDVYGAYMIQWSPLMCLADQQLLLEIIKPDHIVPIDEVETLPFSLRWFAQNIYKEIKESNSIDKSSTKSFYEHKTFEANTTDCDSMKEEDYTPSLDSTKDFGMEKSRIKRERLKTSKDLDKGTSKNQDKEVLISKESSNQQCTNLIKQRNFVVPKANTFTYESSSDE